MGNDVADGKNWRHVGAHLDVDVDEATRGDGHAGFFSSKLFDIERAPYGLLHQVARPRHRRDAAGFGALGRAFNGL